MDPITHPRGIVFYAWKTIAYDIGVNSSLPHDGRVVISAFGFICPARPAFHSIDV
jgi:hypothetical protein